MCRRGQGTAVGLQPQTGMVIQHHSLGLTIAPNGESIGNVEIDSQLEPRDRSLNERVGLERQQGKTLQVR